MKIFVPQDTTYNQCYVVQSEGVIRAYDRVPSYNTTYNYRDYYIKSDYIYREGQGNWSSYSTLPTCLPSSDITNDIYYRIDFASILLTFAILCYFIIFLPYRIMSRAFGRWLKI